MNILKKQNWNECMSLLSVIQTIEKIVKQIGKLKETWNDLERASHELGKLLECQSQILISTVIESSDSGSLPMFGVTAEKVEESKDNEDNSWKKGTGYGHGHQSQMNINQVISDSQKKMKLIETQVSVFYDALITQPGTAESAEGKEKLRTKKFGRAGKRCHYQPENNGSSETCSGGADVEIC